jgi:DNA invertase Pin-like site-specific DNA recombinase
VALTEIKKINQRQRGAKKTAPKKGIKNQRRTKGRKCKKKPHQEKNKVKKFRSACIFWVLVLSCIIA